MNYTKLCKIFVVSWILAGLCSCGKKDQNKTTIEEQHSSNKASASVPSEQLTSEEVAFEKELQKLRDVIPTLEDLDYQPAKNGITTGRVVICGRFIPPPYEFAYDFDNYTLLLNGIQVDPSNKITKLCYQRLNAKKITTDNKIRDERRRLRQTEEYKTKCQTQLEIIQQGHKVFHETLKNFGVKKDAKLKPRSLPSIYRAAKKTKEVLESKWPELVREVVYKEKENGSIIILFKRDRLPICLLIQEIKYPRLHKKARKPKPYTSVKFNGKTMGVRDVDSVYYKKERLEKRQNLLMSPLIKGSLLFYLDHASYGTIDNESLKSITKIMKLPISGYEKKRKIIESIYKLKDLNKVQERTLHLMLISGIELPTSWGEKP